MRKTINLLLALVAVFAVVSCDDYETYGEKKEAERDAINNFIAKNGIRVIDEATFHANGDVTDLEKNEYVLVSRSGVYLQIVRKGCGTKLEENKQVNVLCRFSEYNILTDALTMGNDYDSRNPEVMTVSRTGNNYTASFSSGIMFNNYGASVPAGWLVPLQFVNLGRQKDPSGEIAKVKVIVPHSQGHSSASSSVYACHYVITYQREK